MVMRDKKFVSAIIFAMVITEASCLAAQELCSTEIVNGDCTLTVDRSYPVTLPTIQMRAGKKVTVKINNTQQFEVLSLDPQSAQAIAGTDQIAGFITAAMPDVKGVAFTADLSSGTRFDLVIRADDLNLSNPPNANVLTVKKELSDLKKRLDAVYGPVTSFSNDATQIYLQLQEITSPIPRPVNTSNPATIPAETNVRPQGIVSNTTPIPWGDNYPEWRNCLLHELLGSDPPPVCPQISFLLNRAADLQTSWAKSAGPPVAYPVFNKTTFDTAATQAQTDINALSPQDQVTAATPGGYTAVLTALVQREKSIVDTIPSSSVVIIAESAAVLKDLEVYASNIYLADGLQRASLVLGKIYDPIVDPNKDKIDKTVSRKDARRLGRQVVFSVNTVNEISTSVASVPSATQKKSIATITVLYADPIFEVSAGAFFSTLPDRSFSNQTLVTQNTNSSPVQGNIVIAQTVQHPTVVPFVGANWRLGHDFPWYDRRRGAFYLTGTIGLNPNNITAEYGVGGSLSWRAIMFSPLFHFGHDVRLTQGEYVGEVWCNVSGAMGPVAKCSGNPPSPSTEKYWKVAFAVGISVRVPSVFSGSGSSGASGGGH
jgi:hypothetical protein